MFKYNQAPNVIWTIYGKRNVSFENTSNRIVQHCQKTITYEKDFLKIAIFQGLLKLKTEIAAKIYGN